MSGFGDVSSMIHQALGIQMSKASQDRNTKWCLSLDGRLPEVLPFEVPGILEMKVIL